MDLSTKASGSALTWPLPENLSELLTRHVREQPERVAVAASDLRTVISYRQLDALVRSATEQLSGLGLRRGDTVVLVSDKQHIMTLEACEFLRRCGRETVVIGYEESSQLDVEPARYFVLVTKREKRACRSCEELGVASAPLPSRIIEKCLASDRIVIDTVIGKYCNHTPLHRQSMILEREIGLEISRATLDGWVLKVGELLIPMVAATPAAWAAQHS